jgi:sulfate permease, SulP family
VDYNSELVTVGISNLVTGLIGVGFTGSYIFSQTVFTQRSGCTHRLNGYVVVVAELLLFLVPMSFVQYLPNFYYGALMLVFGLEIALEWLVLSFSKFTRGEYVLTLSVFVIIIFATSQFKVSGLEIGIAVGVLICALYFAVEYGKLQIKTLTAVISKSSCIRPLLQRATLEIFCNHLCAPAVLVVPSSTFGIWEHPPHIFVGMRTFLVKAPPVRANVTQAPQCTPEQSRCRAGTGTLST